MILSYVKKLPILVLLQMKSIHLFEFHNFGPQIYLNIGVTIKFFAIKFVFTIILNFLTKIRNNKDINCLFSLLNRLEECLAVNTSL